MSSDGYFEDDIDSAFLEQVDAIEAAHVSKQPSSVASSSTLVSVPTSKAPPPKPKEVIEIDDDDFDDSYAAFDIDEEQLRHFDEICNVQAATTAPSSRKPVSRFNSKGKVQTTLFGEIAVQNAPSNKGSGSSAQRTASNSRIPIARPKKTKQWDRTAFAKSGWKKPKGKAKASFDGEDEEVEEEWDEPVEFEQFPKPEIEIGYVDSLFIATSTLTACPTLVLYVAHIFFHPVYMLIVHWIASSYEAQTRSTFRKEVDLSPKPAQT